MNETLEQISERILNEVSQDGWLCGYEAVEEFARRLVAALGAQKPVAEAQNGGVVLWAGMYPAAGTELYAAPVVKEGEVVVTTDKDGRAVAVTRQDEKNRILNIIWKAPIVKKDWQPDPNCTCDEHGACAYCWNGRKLAAAPEYKP